MSDEGGQTALRVAQVDRYRIEKELGSGGFGAVFAARHVHTHQPVALKTLKKQLSSDQQMVERFLREARAAASVGNEHIVKVMDAGLAQDGTAFLAMELLQGEDLHHLSTRSTPPSFERLIDLLSQTLEGLHAAHQAGIVHRDLKPANVFVTQKDGRDFVKLLDFGISKFHESLEANGGLTSAGIAMGTPGYMAPEQFFDARADLYSVGAMAYQLFSGRLPIEFTNVAELITRVRVEVPPPLSTLVPGLAPAVAAAVDKALARVPNDRFGSALEFASALRGALGIRGGARLATDAALSAPKDAAMFAATLPPTPAPAALAPSVAPVSGAVSSLLARVGIRGRQSQRVVVVAWVLGLAMLLALYARGRSAPLASDGVTRWVLVKSNCPAGTVPPRVETTTRGTKVFTRAEGFPDSQGTTRTDGSFRVSNHQGTCTGRVTGDTVRETCTNRFGQSCNLTYELED
jgi:eukaryotic-like serine/threonine-protein kinase